jgi:hypothetical protein
MAQVQGSSESEGEEYHSLSGNEPDVGEDEDAEEILEPPVHPVPSMQGAFEESILESTEEDETVRPASSHDAETRRQQLLEAQQYDERWETRWRQKKGAQYHPLLKLMAQIVFGMHLLQQGQAKSNEEVVKILQTHVNEVDTFLERTAEDFDLAIADIEERIRHLKLPMQHINVFNSMLDDKKFRTQLLEGNDRIERIIDRTAKAKDAALMDVKKGLKATQDLGGYLESLNGHWPTESGGIEDVYDAMRGNEQGWTMYLKNLQVKGHNLGSGLVQLGTVIGEISKLAAAASRRNAAQGRAVSPSRSTRSAPVSPGLRSKFAREDQAPMPAIALALNKPLPREPDVTGGAARARATVPKPHPVPFAQRYEKPRQSPQSPAPSGQRVSTMPSSTPRRPKTAGAPRDARPPAVATSDLADFLRNSGPLRSNPPESQTTSSDVDEAAGSGRVRSKSQGGNSVPVMRAAEVARSKSHGAAVILTSSGHENAKARPATRETDKGSDAVSNPASRKDSVAR